MVSAGQLSRAVHVEKGGWMDRRGFLMRGAGLLAAGAAALASDALVPALAKPMTPTATGWVWDDIFLTPFFSPTHPEQPERVAAIRRAIEARGLAHDLRPLAIRQPTEDELRLIHTDAHIAGIRRNHGEAIDRLGRAGVGAALAACEAVHARKVRNAFVCSRPPGHHARNDGEVVGFCLYNNVAVAARHLQRNLGYTRILIVDWDYHHGDGTEHFFYDDPSVLLFDTHDWRAYPRTGDPARRGSGEAVGTKISVDLPCGATDAQMLRAYDEQLIAAADAFRPEFVLISAGFDSRTQDKLGCFDITDAGYRQMTERVRAIARRYCGERVVSVLEGGYNFEGIASGV
ncbi:MAG: histone deacetylase, partial [Betaproteobacteria bacterium]|nr:histone deacetylase [Betaproteobacteria bacterium]